MKRLGDRIATSIDLPAVIFFISTFCSKCMYNRSVLQRVIKEDYILEVNIADSSPLLSEIKPKMAPTIVFVDEAGRILVYEEGVIHDQTALAISQLLENII